MINDNNDNSNGFVFPEIKEQDTDAVILRHIIEFENTKLKENNILKQINNLEDETNFLTNPREKKALKKKLKDIQDRYRLNNFVIEKDGGFFCKYKEFDGKITLNNFEKDDIEQLKELPKLSITIPKETKIIKPLKEVTKVSPIAMIAKMQVEEKSSLSNIKVQAGVKLSPPNPRKKFKNLDYTGEMPVLSDTIFTTITNTNYKTYPEPVIKKKMKYNFDKHVIPPERIFVGDITQHRGNTNINPYHTKPKKQNRFVSFMNRIKPAFAETPHKTTSHTNFQRFLTR